MTTLLIGRKTSNHIYVELFPPMTHLHMVPSEVIRDE